MSEPKVLGDPPAEVRVSARDHVDRVTVDAQEILRGGPYAKGAARDLKRLTGLQQAAYFLAQMTGILIAGVIIAVVVFTLATAPTPPVIPTGAADVTLRADLITSYDTLSKAHWTNSVAILQPVIWGGLLPVFTLILGYLFGAQVDQKGNE